MASRLKMIRVLIRIALIWLRRRWRRSPRWLRTALVICLIPIVGFAILDRLFPPKLGFTPEEFSIVVTDREGYPLYSELSRDEIWRYPTAIEKVSPVYLEALLAYEDRWFYYHPGVNPIAMARAMAQNLWSNDVVSGASTLTMQVARLMHPYDQKVGESMWQRLPGKSYQIFRAIQLEVHLSKREILNLYINSAPFGGVIEGVEAASYSYLQKSAAHLTDAEAAMLTAMPQAPSRYRPDRYPDIALQARNKVIERMVTLGYWNRERADMALLETVEDFVWKRPSLAPHLSQRLITEQAIQSAQLQGDQQLIHSTIDSEKQRDMERLLTQYVSALPKPVSAAAMLVDNRNLDVLAYVGSADYLDADRYGYVDMVQALRSPGSTLKPFLFAKAFDEGIIHSGSLMVDADRVSKDYRPANFDRDFNGPVSATQALQWSLNVPAVNLLETYGSQRFASELKNAGLELVLPAEGRPNLAMILGGVGVKMDTLMLAYAALGRGGQTQPLNFYQSNEQKTKSRYLVSEGAAWMTYDILESHLRPDEISRIQMLNRQDFAWKTGTSYGYRDAWAFAVNGAYTIGVWVGRPDGTPSPGHYGAQTAAPVLFQVMDMLQAGRQNGLPQPKNVASATICWPLGQRKEATPESLCHREQTAWILDAMVPPSSNLVSNFAEAGAKVEKVLLTPERDRRTSRQCHLNAVQAEYALWPLEAEPWLSADRRRSALFPPVDKICNLQAVQADSVEILFPENGSRFIRHKTRGQDSSQSIEIPLKASSIAGKQYWYVNGEHRLTQQGGTAAMLSLEQPGSYRIQVFTETSQSQQIEIEVAVREI